MNGAGPFGGPGLNGNGSGSGVGPASNPANFSPQAAHQAELTYIWNMVEELSRQLAENRRKTEDMISGIGKIREKAREQNLTNDEIIAAAADNLQAQNARYDEQISLLEEALEKSKHSRDGHKDLLDLYRQAMTMMLQQFHNYKAQHVDDVCAWHRSYRAQLVEAREENARLREQLWDMQHHASRANEWLRQLTQSMTEDEARHQQTVDRVAARQELRFWKRMALPHIPDDDPMWSDDDDLVDVSEKRLAAEQAAAAAAAAAATREGGGMMYLHQ